MQVLSQQQRALAGLGASLATRGVAQPTPAALARSSTGALLLTAARRGSLQRAHTAAPESEELVVQTPTYKNAGPEPKTFSVAEGQLTNVGTAALPFVLRLGAGAFCVGYNAQLVPDDGVSYSVLRTNGQMLKETSKVSEFPRPAQPLILYEFEGCPFCKKVREAVTMLDIECIFYPTPSNGDLWRPKAIELGGKKQFPLMVDPNTGITMYESDDIIRYMFQKYGDGQVPSLLTLGFFTTLSAGLGNIGRISKGGFKPSRQPERPLVLYGYEASPFVKIVRETLCAMQIPYLHKPVARGSPRRAELRTKYGTFQAPCLEDPNTESYLFESEAICKYIEDTYMASSSSSASSDAPPASEGGAAAASSAPAPPAPAPAAPSNEETGSSEGSSSEGSGSSSSASA